MSAFSANIGTPSDFYKYPDTRNKGALYIRPIFGKPSLYSGLLHLKRKPNDKKQIFSSQRKFWHKIWI